TFEAQALSQIIGKVDHSPFNCNPNGNPPFWPPFAFPYPPYQWTQPNNGDVFQPAVAMYRDSLGTQHVGAYWNGTNDVANSVVEVDAGFVDGVTPSPIQHLTTANYPLVPAGETSWATTNSLLSRSDYQTMATSWHPANANSG